MIKLEKQFVTFFFLCVLLSIQCTGYIIDEKLLKKRRKSVKNVWKICGKKWFDKFG